LANFTIPSLPSNALLLALFSTLTFLTRFLRRVIIEFASIRPGWAASTATDLWGPAVNLPSQFDLSSIHIMVVAQVQLLVRAECTGLSGSLLDLLPRSGESKCHTDDESKESELHIEMKAISVWRLRFITVIVSILLNGSR
jgi:hypothetical protein